MNANLQPLRDDADRVLDAAVDHALFGSDPITIVKSPPGAGKTYLVESACAVAVAAPGMRVVVVTPGVSQLYDLGDRLLGYQLPRLELVHATHRALPANLVGRINASNGWTPGLNIGPGVVVTNADLLASYLDRLGSGSFDFMIVDESYQLSAAKFMPIADLAHRIIMVGDPGQLAPVISTDVSNLEASDHKIHWSAPAYILDRFPNTPVFGLPVTRRLLRDTAELVQASFYPDLPFRSVVDPRSRRLRFGLAGVRPGIDGALDAIAGGASLVLITVPGEAPAHEEADPGVAAVMAELADRILVRQAEWVGQRILDEADIGIIDPHVLAGGAISDRLRQALRQAVRVDTVEKWQGLQVPISIVRHPLSRPGRPTPFDLQAGRWCVSLSRHQIGCIVVARESVHEIIREYVHGCDTVAAGAKDVTWTGFEAHRTIWKAMVDQRRVFAL
jgi:hypothetical protein